MGGDPQIEASPATCLSINSAPPRHPAARCATPTEAAAFLVAVFQERPERGRWRSSLTRLEPSRAGRRYCVRTSAPRQPQRLLLAACLRASLRLVEQEGVEAASVQRPVWRVRENEALVADEDLLLAVDAAAAERCRRARPGAQGRPFPRAPEPADDHPVHQCTPPFGLARLIMGCPRASM